LEQRQHDGLDVLTHVAGLCKARGIRNGERHIEVLRQRLRKQSLARPGGANEQDVRLLKLNIVVCSTRINTLVVIVHTDGENLLRAMLPDHVLV
jgi:hypothetical protein